MKKFLFIAILICFGCQVSYAQDACIEQKQFAIGQEVYAYESWDEEWIKYTYEGPEGDKFILRKADNRNSISKQFSLQRVYSVAEFQTLDLANIECSEVTQAHIENFRTESLELINNYRTQNGKAKLKMDPVLQKAAQDYVNWYAKYNPTYGSGNSHEADGTTVEQRVLKAARASGALVLNDPHNGDYAFKGVGENLTFGRICPVDAFESWQNSSSHDWQMKYERHQYVGFGIACGIDRNGNRFVVAAQVFGGEKASQEEESAPAESQVNINGGSQTAVDAQTCNQQKQFSKGEMVYAWDNYDKKWSQYTYDGYTAEGYVFIKKPYQYTFQTLQSVYSQAEFLSLDISKGACAEVTDAHVETFRTESLELINGYRRRNGKGQLQIDPVLQKAAQDYVNWCAKNKTAYMSGNSHRADGTTVGERVIKAARALGVTVSNDQWNGDYVFKGVGENLTVGRICPFDAFESWRTSTSGHDWQMKNERHQYIGFGLACGVDQNGNTFVVAAQVFGGEKPSQESAATIGEEYGSITASAAPSYQSTGASWDTNEKNYYSLSSGEEMLSSNGDTLYSADRSHFMTLQPDGYLIIAKSKNKKLVWKNSTRAEKLKLENGELMLLTDWGSVDTKVWSSKTSGSPYCRLVLGNDGGLMIKNERNEVIWPAPIPKGTRFMIKNPYYSPNGELTVGYTDTYQAYGSTVEKASLAADNFHGETFLTPNGKAGTIESCAVRIKRHPDQATRGKLFIDMYKVVPRDRGGADPMPDEDYLQYVGSSDAVANPQGKVIAKFSDQITLAPSSKYAFIIRTQGFDKYAIGASSSKEGQGYMDGSIVSYRQVGDYILPPNDAGFPNSSGLYADLYFEITMIAE
jgi:uncharacterized protein YkwD